MADSDAEAPTILAPASSARALRRAVVGALCAELGHDLQNPANLFRLAKERLARGELLDEDDVSSLDEELGRLSRLCGRLRALAQSSLVTQTCSPREIVDAALRSAPLDLGRGELELELDSSFGIVCDPVVLGRALRELLDNALEARARRAGVRFRAGEDAGLCVWDDGPGLELPPTQAMSWGVTTRPAAAGLGLTLALRAARAHGFSLQLRREAPLTEAWLLFPARFVRATQSEGPR